MAVAIRNIMAIKDAVIMRQTPAPLGMRVDFQPQHTADGFVREGVPLDITVRRPGQIPAGFCDCENCGARLQPTFYAAPS